MHQNKLYSTLLSFFLAISSSVCIADVADPKLEQKLVHLMLNTKSPDVVLYSPDKPFTLKSGKVSPIFCNLGNFTTGESISRLGDIYAEAIVNNKLEFDVIYGSAYKGIPLSVTIARSLYEKYGKNVPYAFNRKEAKDHGEGGIIIGADMAGKKVLLVDDVITSGKSTIESIEIIEKAGGKPVALVVSVDRRETIQPLPGNLPVIGMTTLEEVLKAKQQQVSAQKKSAEVIVALDVQNKKQVDALIAKLDPKLCKVKVGLQLFTAEGPSIVKHLRSKGFEVFLDQKYLDIPNTVYNAVWQAAELNVWMLTVHTTGSDSMLLQARQAATDFSKKYPEKRAPLIVGVTILTSVSDAELKSTFKFNDMPDAVLKLALRAKHNNLDGIVCSPNEAEMIRAHNYDFGSNFVIVTPGIRLDDNVQDQVRVATPELAVKSGSNFLVVGRPIIEAKNPNEALLTFVQRIKTATG
jgi:orotidine-5'-phosphate decarboxylase